MIAHKNMHEPLTGLKFMASKLLHLMMLLMKNVCDLGRKSINYFIFHVELH